MLNKKFLKAFLIIFAFIFSITTFQNQAISSEKINVKNFYKSLSKRLGRARSDYPNLSDYQFANFREVVVTGISPRKLFRSSSPVDDWGNRNLIADNAAEKFGVKTFINLADSQKSLIARQNFYDTYYSKQAYICLNLSTKYYSNSFKNNLAKGIKFMAAHEPPYLIHCSLGKDRAGIVCALVECLAGASFEEIVNDYMISFYNYFCITKNSQEYDLVVNNEIRAFLSKILDVKNPENANLKIAAENYFKNLGVSDYEIKILREKLN